MSVIAEIRKRGWLMLILVGLALFAFLVDPQTLLNFSLSSKDKIGEVGGEEIRIAEYEDLKSRVTKQYKDQTGFSANRIDQVVWDELINQKIVKIQVEKLDILPAEEEFLAFAAQQFGFVTPDGKPDILNLKKTLAEWKKGADTNPDFAQKLSTWEQNQSMLAKGLNQKKYLDLASSGFLQTKAEMDFMYALQNDSNAVSFVKIDYAKASQGENIVVSNKEIEEYINIHPKKYTLEESRSIDYVYQKSAPSEKDVLAIQKEIQSFLTGKTFYDKNQEVVETLVPFAQAENDSVWVTNYSDRVIPWTYFTATELKQIFSEQISQFALNASVGQTSGVIRTSKGLEDSFSIAKLNNKKSITDSALVSHILVTHIGSPLAANTNKKIVRNESQAKATADSLFALVQKNPSSFNELLKISDDSGLIANAEGKLPWITKNMTGAPPLTDFALNNPVNKTGLIKTDLGYHIIRVENTKSKLGYRLAVIAKNIFASEETANLNYEKISNFYEKVLGKSRAEFSKAANKENLEFYTKEKSALYETNLPGINNNKDAEILRWAFGKDTKVGDVKKFTTDNEDQIVVFLANKHEKGLASVESVKTEVSEILKKQKIAEQLSRQYASMSLEQIASKFGVEVKTSAVNYNNSSDIELQNEAKVIGAAVGLKIGKKSEAIPGKMAVFFVRKEAEKAQNPMPKEFLQFVYNQYRSSARREGIANILASLKDFYQPIDERIKLLQFTTE